MHNTTRLRPDAEAGGSRNDPGTTALDGSGASAWRPTLPSDYVPVSGTARQRGTEIIGLHLMAEAGYDPRSALDFWQRGTLSGGEMPLEFLSSHPSSMTRIENLRQQMPMALERHDRHYY